MRGKPLFGALLLLLGTAAFQLLPASGGQHYTAAVQQAISAIGNVRGGGASTSASASVEPAAAASVSYTATFSTTTEAGVELTLGSLLSPTSAYDWHARVELSTGEVCSSNQPLSGFVDPTASVGVIAFSDGGCTVTIVLLGQGAPNIVPQTDLQNPADPERILASAGLMNSRAATVVGGIISGATVRGVPSGSGSMEAAIDTELSSTPASATCGGTIDVGDQDQNRKANFGCAFSGSLVPTGNLTYHDHITEAVFKSTAVQRFVVTGNTARISGTGRLGSVPGYSYDLTLTDDPDTFAISWTGPSGSYSASGPVQGSVTVAG